MQISDTPPPKDTQHDPLPPLLQIQNPLFEREFVALKTQIQTLKNQRFHRFNPQDLGPSCIHSKVLASISRLICSTKDVELTHPQGSIQYYEELCAILAERLSENQRMERVLQKANISSMMGLDYSQLYLIEEKIHSRTHSNPSSLGRIYVQDEQQSEVNKLQDKYHERSQRRLGFEVQKEKITRSACEIEQAMHKSQEITSNPTISKHSNLQEEVENLKLDILEKCQQIQKIHKLYEESQEEILALRRALAVAENKGFGAVKSSASVEDKTVENNLNLRRETSINIKLLSRNNSITPWTAPNSQSDLQTVSRNDDLGTPSDLKTGRIAKVISEDKANSPTIEADAIADNLNKMFGIKKAESICTVESQKEVMSVAEPQTDQTTDAIQEHKDQEEQYQYIEQCQVEFSDVLVQTNETVESLNQWETQLLTQIQQIKERARHFKKENRRKKEESTQTDLEKHKKNKHKKQQTLNQDKKTKPEEVNLKNQPKFQNSPTNQVSQSVFLEMPVLHIVEVVVPKYRDRVVEEVIEVPVFLDQKNTKIIEVERSFETMPQLTAKRYIDETVIEVADPILEERVKEVEQQIRLVNQQVQKSNTIIMGLKVIQKKKLVDEVTIFDEYPVQVQVLKIVEVPVLKEVEKILYIQRPQERIVQTVERIVVKEEPVLIIQQIQRTKVIEKLLPAEKIVETVEKIVEVPVQIVIEKCTVIQKEKIVEVEVASLHIVEIPVAVEAEKVSVYVQTERNEAKDSKVDLRNSFGFDSLAIQKIRLVSQESMSLSQQVQDKKKSQFLGSATTITNLQSRTFNDPEIESVKSQEACVVNQTIPVVQIEVPVLHIIEKITEKIVQQIVEVEKLVQMKSPPIIIQKIIPEYIFTDKVIEKPIFMKPEVKTVEKEVLRIVEKPVVRVEYCEKQAVVLQIIQKTVEIQKLVEVVVEKVQERIVEVQNTILHIVEVERTACSPQVEDSHEKVIIIDACPGNNSDRGSQAQEQVSTTNFHNTDNLEELEKIQKPVGAEETERRLQDENQQLRSSITTLTMEYTETQERLSHKLEEYSILEAAKQRLENSLKQVNEESANIQEALAHSATEVTRLRNQIMIVRSEKQKNQEQVAQMIDELTKKLEAEKKANQLLRSEFEDVIQEKETQKNTEIQSYKRHIQQNQEEIAELQQLCDSLQKDFQELRDQRQSLIEEVEHYRNQLEYQKHDDSGQRQELENTLQVKENQLRQLGCEYESVIEQNRLMRQYLEKFAEENNKLKEENELRQQTEEKLIAEVKNLQANLSDVDTERARLDSLYREMLQLCQIKEEELHNMTVSQQQLENNARTAKEEARTAREVASNSEKVLKAQINVLMQQLQSMKGIEKEFAAQMRKLQGEVKQLALGSRNTLRESSSEEDLLKSGKNSPETVGKSRQEDVENLREQNIELRRMVAQYQKIIDTQKQITHSMQFSASQQRSAPLEELSHKVADFQKIIESQSAQNIELRQINQQLAAEKEQDASLMEKLVEQLERTKTDIIKHEVTIKNLNNRISEYERKIIDKNKQISQLTLKLVRDKSDSSNHESSQNNFSEKYSRGGLSRSPDYLRTDSGYSQYSQYRRQLDRMNHANLGLRSALHPQTEEIPFETRTAGLDSVVKELSYYRDVLVPELKAQVKSYRQASSRNHNYEESGSQTKSAVFGKMLGSGSIQQLQFHEETGLHSPQMSLERVYSPSSKVLRSTEMVLRSPEQESQTSNNKHSPRGAVGTKLLFESYQQYNSEQHQEAVLQRQKSQASIINRVASCSAGLGFGLKSRTEQTLRSILKNSPISRVGVFMMMLRMTEEMERVFKTDKRRLVILHPENIFVDGLEDVNNLRVRINEFNSGTDIGSLWKYKAPELLLEGSYSESSVVWNIGCLFDEIVHGSVFFQSEQEIIDAAYVYRYRNGVGQETKKILVKSLVKDASQRLNLANLILNLSLEVQRMLH